MRIKRVTKEKSARQSTAPSRFDQSANRNASAFKVSPMAIAVACATANIIAPIASAEESRFVMEEVIVTATRRGQSVQDVPYNISAYTSDDLASSRAFDLSAFSRMVPGLAYTDQGPAARGNNNNFILRGLNANSAINGANLPNLSVAPVSTYFGETPIFFPITLSDIERVEVLRGPQGTLYGSGSAGGTIRFIPNAPDPTGFLAEINVSTSFTADAGDPSYDLDAVLNIPLSDNTAVRLVAGYEQQAGFIDAKGLVVRDGNSITSEPIAADPTNPFSGFVVQPTRRDVNESENWFVRTSLLFEPSDLWSIQLNYHHEDQSQNSPQIANPGYAGGRIDTSDTFIPGARFSNDFGCPGGCYSDPGEGGTVFPAAGDNEQTKMILEPYERKVDLYNVDVEVDFGFATMTSSTSYYENESTYLNDGTGFFSVPASAGAPSLAYFYGFYPRLVVLDDSATKDDGFVQEIRLASTWDRQWDFVAGVFYQDQQSTLDVNEYIPGVRQFALDALGFAAPNPQLGDIALTIDRKFQFKESAIFGEVTFHPSERWQITGGIRVFSQKFTNDLVSRLPFCGSACANDQADPLGTTAISNKDDVSDQIYKFNTSYDINENTMAYFTWAEGFRRGGANTVSTGGVFASLPTFTTFKSDKATNWEVGLKGTLWERVNYTVTGFLIQWDDFQFDDFNPSGLSYVVNGDEAESRGLELELNGQLSEQFSFSFGYGYTDAKVTKDFAITDLPIAGLFNDPVTTVEQIKVFKGDPLPAVPQNSLTFSADYLVAMGNGMDLNFHLNGVYRDATQSTFNRVTQDGRQFFEIDAFSVWGSSVTLSADVWSVSLFIDNIGNETGTTGGIPETAFNSRGQWFFVTRPRTAGLHLRYAMK